jgi:hypothetical protein
MGSGTLVAVVSGVAAGLGGAWIGLAFLGRASAPSAKSVTAEHVTAATKVSDPLVTRLSADDAKAAGSECAAPKAEGAGSAQDDQRVARGVPLTRPTEADRTRDTAALREAQQNRIVAHQQEPRDLSWARDTETTLNAGFRDATQVTSSTLENLECRSVSCLARFSWPDEATARTKMWDLVTRIGPTAPGASRFFNLEVGDGKGPTKATMILDFTDAENDSDTN